MRIDLKAGDEVLFVAGQDKGKFGTYLYHERDSGYLVPHVDMGDGIISKPWEYEIICLRVVKEIREEALARIEEMDEQILRWTKVKNSRG